MDDYQLISRATSVSRTSQQGLTISRDYSLIKKNVAPQDLKPSDVLIERFVAWKAIVKQLIGYFEGIADIEGNTARELTRLGTVIQVPFRSGNQFLGEGGLQDVYYCIRDKTRMMGDQHANLSRTIDGSIVQHLKKLRREIKAHIWNIQNDTGKLAVNVAKERELSSHIISELSSHVSFLKNTPLNVTSKTDPYVSNLAVSRQLKKQVHEENLLQKSIIVMQQNSAHFEEGIIRALQSAWQTFDEWQSRASLSIHDAFSTLSTQFRALSLDSEWVSFAERSDHLLDPATPLRDPTHISYPSKDDPSVIPVHIGHLERKKRFTRRYRECYFVLTPAGFLHEYASTDMASHDGQTPMFSLFLPACTLGPPAPTGAGSHKFHIEERRDGTGMTKSVGFSTLGRRRGRAWSFRARSREEMMEWWNDLKMLCARFLISSEQMERSGIIAAAVRSVGYLSESGEERNQEQQEEECSSVKEEIDESVGVGEEAEGEEFYEDASTEPPGYLPSHQEARFDVGYSAEKKPKNNNENGSTLSGDNAGAPSPTLTVGDFNVARRSSRRQQGKAPEDRAPHTRTYTTPDNDEVPQEVDLHT